MSMSGSSARASHLFAGRRIAVWIFLAALVVRAGLIFGLGSYRSVERTEVVNVAISLSRNGGFADAFGAGSGPTAHCAPVYPLLLSLVFRLFGTGAAGEIGQELLSSAIASLTCALLPFLAVAFGLDRRVGVAAGIWAALLPANFWAETKGSFEAALTGLAIALICLHSAGVWRRGRLSGRDGVAGGILAGLAVLTSPVVVPVTGGLLAAGGYLFRARFGAYIRYAGVFLAVAFACLAPWGARNKAVMGSLILTRSNFPLELFLANNDDARADGREKLSGDLVVRYHPHANLAVRAALIEQGEVAFQRDRLNKVLGWIKSRPERFIRLTAERIYRFWFPRMTRPAQTFFMRIQTIGGLLGLILLWRTNRRGKWIAAAIWLCYPAVYYVVQPFSRYRYPIEWSLLLLACFAASRAALLGRVATQRSSDSARASRAGGV